jgi:hypothetical protein
VPSKEENEEMNLLFHYPNAFEDSNICSPKSRLNSVAGISSQVRSPLSRRLSLKSFPILSGEVRGNSCPQL